MQTNNTSAVEPSGRNALPFRLAGKREILVIDDFFPNLTTGFRVAEYSHYLRVFPNLTVASTIGDFRERHAIFSRSYPDLRSRVVALDPTLLSQVKLGYLNFLNNVHYHLASLEAALLPFFFTLYPGGGFELHSEETDLKLRRVLDSPMLRAVISTQSITTDFLRRMQCPVEIHEIYGAAINPAYTSSSSLAPVRRNINADSSALNICFVAHKYDLTGLTKGYPAFTAAAAELASRFPNVEFSVVGNYRPEDIDIPDHLRSRLQFKGLLTTLQLRDFLFTQDLMISPNQPYTVSGSMFDGFPTASCVEASLCGVALLCSDELDLNRFYEPDELIICSPDVSAIVDAAERLLVNSPLIAQIGARGRQKSLALFSAEAQLLPRTRLLRELAAGEGIST